MTITSGNPPAPQNTTMGAAFTAAQAPAPQASGQAFSFFGANAFTSIGGRHQAGESLTRTLALFQEIIKNNINIPKQYSISFIPLDNQKETGLWFSAIILTVQDGSNQRNPIYYHTFILEGSGEPLVPRYTNINSTQVEITRAPSDAYDKTMDSLVKTSVRMAFPNAVSCVSCDGEVVFKFLNLEDKPAVNQLLNNGLMACTVESIRTKSDYEELNLVKAGRDHRLVANTNFGDDSWTDYAGLPVRNSIQIALSAQPAQARPNNNLGSLNNSQDKSVALARIGGFIEFIYAPENNNTGQRIPFTGRFIMTNMENLRFPTPAGSLLALIASTALNLNYSWLPFCRPKLDISKGNSVDYKDIGVLNIEGDVIGNENLNFRPQNFQASYGKKVDLKAGNAADADLYRFLAMSVSPNLSLSVDVSEFGADTWYMSLFMACANGRQEAITALYDAANSLTNGAFAKFYDGRESPILQDRERVHMGFFTDANGQQRDVREIDYIAIMNLLGERDPKLGAEWASTFFQTNIDGDIRLAARKKLIEASRVDVTYTGYARRVTFNAKFIAALTAAARECGLDIQATSQLSSSDLFSQRMAPGFISQSRLGGQSPVFNQGFGQALSSQSSVYGNNTGNRW